MLFTEPAFLFFFLPLVVGVHWVVPRGWRNRWLLLASLWFFVSGESRWGWLLLVSVGWNYAIGLGVSGSAGRWRCVWLTVGVAVNLAPLVVFKVLQGMGGVGVPAAGGALGGGAGLGVPSGLTGGGGLLIPLGLSFYSLHAISYLVDVYRGTSVAVRSPVSFGVYMAMFPQLISGPIVRYGQVAAELGRRWVSVEDLGEGVRRFVIGLGKKVLIADTVGVRADQVFALPPEALDATTAWIGVVCYGVQVYFDFSGYTDMAIGLARMLGFRFPENFDDPYMARSVGDFWRRWHMTLMTFLRDYVYIPLGGNRAGEMRTALNIGVVFVLSALWHCPSWMFLGRAGFFAGVLLAERWVGRTWKWRWPAAVGHGYVLLVLMVGWVVFRAPTWGQAWGMYAAMFGWAEGAPTLTARYLLSPEVVVALVAGVVGCTGWPRREAARWVEVWQSGWRGVLARSAEVVWLVVVLLASVVASSGMERAPFLYYQF